MKIRGKRVGRALICLALASFLAVLAFWVFGTESAESLTVSAGLQHLADRSFVAASAKEGETISFDASFFDRAMMGSAVTGITVSGLPDITCGELKLGYGEVRVGQYIDRNNLAYLSFAPVQGAKSASFSFLPQSADGDCGYTVRCFLNSTADVNCCPVGTGSVTAVSTHETLALNGTLFAEDPEGDALFFEVVSYPENGTLSLDMQTGEFSYLPTGDFCGEDSFWWRVQDANGAYAEPCEVKITVRELTTGYLFSDMNDTRLHSAALRVCEKGLMGGEKLGGGSKNVVLNIDDFSKIFFIEAPEGIGAFAENTGIGTGHIRPDDIILSVEILRSCGDHPIITAVNFKVFTGAFLTAGTDIGGSDSALFTAQLSEHQRLTSGSGTEIQYRFCL